MKYDVVVIRSDEIFLKGKNRNKFIKSLKNRINEIIKPDCVRKISEKHDSIIVKLSPNYDNSRFRLFIKSLSSVYGIKRYFKGFVVEKNIDKLIDYSEIAATEFLKNKKRTNQIKFRLTVKRKDKTFPLNSMQIIDKIAETIEKRFGFSVDLTNYDFNLKIEIDKSNALVYFEDLKGPGGLPTGINGNVLLLLSGGIDSPVASDLLMKRGCSVKGIFFDSYPLITERAWEKVKKISEQIAKHQSNFILYRAKFSDIQVFLRERGVKKLLVILQRRAMYRIAELLADKINCDALATGDNLGQVSSQTISNLYTLERAVNMPVLRPLLTYNKDEIISLSKRLGYYDFSIETSEDPCSLYIPKHPELKSNPDYVENVEKKLEPTYSNLLESCFENLRMYEF